MGTRAVEVTLFVVTRSLFLIVMLASLGCRVGPDYCVYAPPVPDVWHQELVEGDFAGDHELHQWWCTLNDPTLDVLISRARVNNRDLYAAVSRIQQAAAQSRIAASPRFPFVDNVGSFENFKLSENGPLFFPGLSPDTPLDKWTTGFDVSWEPDVYGRISRSIDAAHAQTAATVEQYRDVLVCLYAEVARNYIFLRALQAQKQYTVENLELQRESVQQAEDRLEAGLVPELDVHQAELNVHRTAADVPRLEEAIQKQLNVIALLLGEFPGRVHILLEPIGPIPNPPTSTVQLPINMVRQRPDIRQAERLVAAQTEQIGIAVSDLYPRFSIGGSFSLESQDFSELLQADSFTYGLGPSFRWAIFQGGRIRGNIAQQVAATEQAIANYEQTILNAFREVEDALAGYREEQLRVDELTKAVDAAEKAVENVNALYVAGQTNFQNVLVTEQSLSQTQNQLAESEGRVAINLVLLYKALGGGWHPKDHDRRHSTRVRPPTRFAITPEEVVAPDEWLNSHSSDDGEPEPTRSPANLHQAMKNVNHDVAKEDLGTVSRHTFRR